MRQILKLKFDGINKLEFESYHTHFQFDVPKKGQKNRGAVLEATRNGKPCLPIH